MGLLVDYDRWCENRVRALLLLLEEWLSISQKYVERGMILLYLVLVNAPPNPVKMNLYTRLFSATFVAYLMWTLHRRPEALRERSKWMPAKMHACMRLTLQSVLGFVIVLEMTDARHHGTIIASQIVYGIFYYMTDGIVPAPAEKTEMPSGKWVQRVPKSLHRKLTILAKAEGVSLNQLVTAVLAETVGRKKPDAPV